MSRQLPLAATGGQRSWRLEGISLGPADGYYEWVRRWEERVGDREAVGRSQIACRSQDCVTRSCCGRVVRVRLENLCVVCVQEDFRNPEALGHYAAWKCGDCCRFGIVKGISRVGRSDDEDYVGSGCHGVGVLDVEAGLNGPANGIVRIPRVEGRTASVPAEDCEGRGTGKAEVSVKGGKVGRYCRASECIHD